jgi:hypothetical protein
MPCGELRESPILENLLFSAKNGEGRTGRVRHGPLVELGCPGFPALPPEGANSALCR